MAWRDQLRAASFRGVPFFVDGHDLESGRRGPLHEYPQRDEPYFEDLGRKARQYQITAHVVGPGYMEDRDRLLAALERRGSGTLVHHYLGEVEVACQSFRLREATADGGLASFEITFVEAGQNRQPSAVPSTGTRARAAGAGVTAALQSMLSRLLSVSGPGYLAAAAASIVEGLAVELLGAALGASTGESFAAFSRGCLRLAAEAATRARAPAALGGEIAGLFETLGALFADPANALRRGERLSSFGAGLAAVRETTEARVQQARNQRSIVAVAAGSAAVMAAQASATMTFASYQDAAGVRDRVTALLDAEMERAGDSGEDAVYEALAELYAAVVRDLTTRGASLAPLTTFEPRATRPALTIAYQLYGDAGRADEIIARNRLRHPGFVAGGRALEVLAVG